MKMSPLPKPQREKTPPKPLAAFSTVADIFSLAWGEKPSEIDVCSVTLSAVT